MQTVFGEDGFALHELPQGQKISPEEFSEFGNAYQVFAETSKFAEDIRTAQKPLLYVEGTTDIRYLQRAAELLGKGELLKRVDIRNGEGQKLRDVWNAWERAWKASSRLADVPTRKVIFIFDCDYTGACVNIGNLLKRKIPRQCGHPLEKGIENLFSKKTLKKALNHKSAFIDITNATTATKRGKHVDIPEKWSVNGDEKTNLCDWLCENGTKDDFQCFQTIFDLLEKVLD